MFNYFTQVIYVQLSPERVRLSDPRSGLTLSEVPEIAITRQPKLKVLAVGTRAREYKSNPDVEIHNPFAHPRSMVSDFTLGEQTLKAFLVRIKPIGIFTPAPKMVVHLLGEPAGGFTQIEARAFHEMALGAGASQVTVWQGRTLTDQELLSGQFTEGGRVLS